MRKFSQPLLTFSFVTFGVSCRVLYVHGPEPDGHTGIFIDTSSTTEDAGQTGTDTSGATEDSTVSSTTDTDYATTSTSPIDNLTSTFSEETTLDVVAACGNGSIDGDEQCDDGSMNGVPIKSEQPAECTSNCTIGILRAFVTSQSYKGDLGGIYGGDQKCQDSAKEAKLRRPENFIAWLAGPGEDNITPDLGSCNIPYYQMNDIILAADANSLISIAPQDESHFLYITENKKKEATEFNVWSCISAQGTRACDAEQKSCAEWTSSGMQDGGIGRAGSESLDKACPGKESGTWTNCNSLSCKDTAHLYCFEKCPQ